MGEQTDEAAFMADSQVPWGVEALSGAITKPAGQSVDLGADALLRAPR